MLPELYKNIIHNDDRLTLPAHPLYQKIGSHIHPAAMPEDSFQEPDLSNVSNDEISLSPASRNVIEKCAVPAAPPIPTKDLQPISNMISRPPSSAFDAEGFHFTKPSQPR